MPLPDQLVRDWKALFAAHHPDNRRVTLATRALDGGPAARIVIWRSFDPERCLLTFSTSPASPKMAELEADPRAVLVAWDAQRQIQWRVDCTMRASVAPGWAARFPVLTSRPVLSISREEAWKHHSRDAQMTFFWPDPSQPMGDEAMTALRRRRNEHAALKGAVPDSFAVLEGEIVAVDRLELAHPIHLRVRYRSVDAWREEALTP